MEGERVDEPKFKEGQRVWYLPQMRMCKVVAAQGGGLYQVEVMDSWRRFVAVEDDLELCEGQEDAGE